MSLKESLKSLGIKQYIVAQHIGVTPEILCHLLKNEDKFKQLKDYVKNMEEKLK